MKWWEVLIAIITAMGGGGALYKYIFVKSDLRKKDLENDELARQEIVELYLMLKENNRELSRLHKEVRDDNRRITTLEASILEKDGLIRAQKDVIERFEYKYGKL